MSKIKVIFWFLSCVISFCIGYNFNTNLNLNESKKILIKQIQGEKIQHSNLNYKGEYISFNTISEGKGIIHTQIPKTNIPEAYSWVYKNHCLQFGLFYHYNNKLFRSYSLTYLYRQNSFSFGAGPIFGDSVGVNIIFQYWFSAN
jgi:hypothetical protein